MVSEASEIFLKGGKDSEWTGTKGGRERGSEEVCVCVCAEREGGGAEGVAPSHSLPLHPPTYVLHPPEIAQTSKKDLYERQKLTASAELIKFDGLRQRRVPWGTQHLKPAVDEGVDASL